MSKIAAVSILTNDGPDSRCKKFSGPRREGGGHAVIPKLTRFSVVKFKSGLNLADQRSLIRCFRIRYFVNCYYCTLGINKVGYIVIRFPLPDYRKSKFGLHRLIKQNEIYSLLHDEARILIFDDPPEENKC